jgi:hypothetical protein
MLQASEGWIFFHVVYSQHCDTLLHLGEGDGLYVAAEKGVGDTIPSKQRTLGGTGLWYDQPCNTRRYKAEPTEE